MKIAVMGPGGVGGYFGARLAAAGNDVTFVARGAHLEAMQSRACGSTARSAPLHLDPVQGGGRCARDRRGRCRHLRGQDARYRERGARACGRWSPRARRSSPSRTASRAPSASARCVGRRQAWCRARRASARHISEPGVIKQIGKFALLEFGEARRQAERAHDRVPRRPARRPASMRTLSRQHPRELWMKFAMLAPLAGLTALTRGPIGPMRANAQIAGAAAVGGRGGGGGRHGAEDRAGADGRRQDHEADRRAAQADDGLDGARPAGRQADRARGCRARWRGSASAAGRGRCRRTTFVAPGTGASYRWKPQAEVIATTPAEATAKRCARSCGQIARHVGDLRRYVAQR